ncbi:YlbL family protein [Actinoplanes sp. NPDC004185]
MRRRGVALVAGAVVTVLLGAGIRFWPLPFVVLEPGPTVDTLGSHEGAQVIAVTGGQAFGSAGQLRLTTVLVDTEVGLREAVEAWFDGDRAVAPRSRVYPAGQSAEQVDRHNAELFASSVRNAEQAARRELGSPSVEVKVDVDEIGGPSAGLMLTLGIIDKLTPADLTGGRIIAGTGTVDEAGAVGPISGVPQKLLGARAAGAELFLVPEANCAEAVRNAVPGLVTARVATVGEALGAVRTYAAGGAPEPCVAA